MAGAAIAATVEWPAPAMSGTLGAIRHNEDFNSGWRFSLAAPADAYRLNLDDASWREVRLPHDWSVEASFNKKYEGATAYLPGGIGWYRKSFPSPMDVTDKVTYLYFDGVYNNAEVWLNGAKLGKHPYGFSPFYYDISALLRTNNALNVVAVKVDRSRYADCRWYPGSGINRNVTLVTASKLHIPVWGTFVTTPEVTERSATVAIAIRIQNNFSDARAFQLVTHVSDPTGEKVATQSESCRVNATTEQTFYKSFTVPLPKLWDTEHPHLYRIVTSIVADGKEVDRYATPFGIRTLRFDPANGFFLNRKHVRLKGICLHQDGGLVGTAVPEGVWRRRLEKLKAAGVNAIRTAHNPPSEEFLILCDKMGFLVMEEFFDEWDYPKDKRHNKAEQRVDYITQGYTEHFQHWAEKDLKNSILRDRNHPSIMMWSIGNEIEWTYPRYPAASGYFDPNWHGNFFWTSPRFPPAEIRKRFEEIPETRYVLAQTAKRLSGWTKDLDITRPVVANLILPSVSYVSGYTDALDVAGFSYRRVVYDYARANFPKKMILGTENVVQWPEWRAVIDRPFVAGTFLWTGIDYLGEASGKWPEKGSPDGMLDLAGFEKPSYHMMKSLWSDRPEIYIATQTMEKSPYRIDSGSGEVVEKHPDSWKHALWVWQPVNEFWNYAADEMTVAEVYSNCQRVELFLNGRSFGIKCLADFPDRIYKWAVPFTSGKLVAKGHCNGRTIETERVTAGAPVTIQLTADRTSLKADGYDVVHVTARLVDKNGVPVRTENRKITFETKGAVKVLGVDNGAVNSVQDYQSSHVLTDQGRCLLIIQSQAVPSQLEISAHTSDMKSNLIRMQVSAPERTHTERIASA